MSVRDKYALGGEWLVDLELTMCFSCLKKNTSLRNKQTQNPRAVEVLIVSMKTFKERLCQNPFTFCARIYQPHFIYPKMTCLVDVWITTPLPCILSFYVLWICLLLIIDHEVKEILLSHDLKTFLTGTQITCPDIIQIPLYLFCYLVFKCLVYFHPRLLHKP